MTQILRLLCPSDPPLTARAVPLQVAVRATTSRTALAEERPVNYDPLSYLLDRTFTADGTPTFVIEQPLLVCPCAGTYWLGRDWLDKRDSQCNCPAHTDDFLHTIHETWCDAVPCPFCPPEYKYIEVKRRDEP